MFVDNDQGNVIDVREGLELPLPTRVRVPG